jgi:hypothetical protein
LYAAGLAIASVLLVGAYLRPEVFWIVVMGYFLSAGLSISGVKSYAFTYWRIFGITWGSMLVLVFIAVLPDCLRAVNPATVFSLAHPSMLFYMLLQADGDDAPRLILFALALCALEAWAARALYRATLDTLNAARPVIWSLEMRTYWRSRLHRWHV